MDHLLIVLTMAACISPLLTITYLFQLKEWRIDRLREHLRSEGWFRSLFGILRPIIIISSLTALFVWHFKFLILTSLSLLTALNIIQIILKKQKYPTWTQKSLILFGTAIFINLIISLFVDYKLPIRPELTAEWQTTNYKPVVLFLPLLQSFVLFFSWLLWLPVDRMLKRHTLDEAKALRSAYPDLIVIGITGSVGKTTTKELLAHILSEKNVIATPAYVNTELGVSQWLLRTLKTVNCKLRTILIVEMGAYKKGEIKTLCDIVQPTIGVITAIGSQHLGLFGSRENIAQAKGELLDALPKSGHAFIPEDTPFIEAVVSRATCHVQRVSPAPRASIALATAVAKHLGMSSEKIDQRITSFTPPPHTFSLRQESNVTILDDTHNVSPESFHTAIEWTASQPQEYKVLITPGIIELGKEENLIHEQLGKKAAPIFNRVIFLTKRHAKMFEEGYSKPVELFSKTTKHVPAHSLLVCIGRMSDKTIQSILP